MILILHYTLIKDFRIFRTHQLLNLNGEMFRNVEIVTSVNYSQQDGLCMKVHKMHPKIHSMQP